MSGKKAGTLYEVRAIEDLREMLNSSASLYGEKTAFMVKDKIGGPYRRISYEQLKKDVDALGTALLDMGLKDKKIAILGANRYQWAVSYLAVVNGVGVAVPLDKELPKEEMDYILDEAGVSAIIYGEKYGKHFRELAEKHPELKVFINMDLRENNTLALSFRQVLADGAALLENGDRAYLEAEIDREAMKILLFTSGTTGLAKGVMLSHKNLVTNLMNMCKYVYLDENDVFLSVLPMHHTYECTCGFLCPIYRGAAIAECEGLRYIVKNLQESRATVMLGVPLLLEGIYKKIWKQAKKNNIDKKLRKAIRVNNVSKKIGADFSKKIFRKIHENFGGQIKIFISGGAAIEPAVAKGLNELGLKTIQGYGLTECSPIIAVNKDVYYKDAAAGIPLQGVEVRIDRPNDEGIGEIIAKSDAVMLGYYNKPEITQEVLKDGWFYTGDLGYFDEDGFLYIAGRKKNVIVTKNGKNIFPEEVEFYLNRNDLIEESLVWGKHNEATGETDVHAQVRLNQQVLKETLGANPSKDRTLKLVKELVGAVNDEMPLYKRIKHFKIREAEFVKTTTQKIKRHAENLNDAD